MPKFLIGRGYGYAGTESHDVIEAENQNAADEAAWQFALENVEAWSEPYDPEKHDGLL